MKVEFESIYGFPIPVIYQPSLVPKKFTGFATMVMFYPVVVMRKKSKAVLAHELAHVRQMFRYLFIGYAIGYRFNKKFRCKMEVEAYRAQLAKKPEKEREHFLSVYSNFIAKKYGLDVTAEQALDMLTEDA